MVFPNLKIIQTLELPDEQATLQAGADFARQCKAGDFIGLIGPLGAGKTSFVRGLMAELGHADVMSPTYTLVNTYDTSPKVHHFDLYRLGNIDDLETVGFWDYITDDALILVEWIDRVPESWPGHGRIVELAYAGNSRVMSIWATEP